MEATFVVVGGGIAGVSCTETLAYLNPNESIILISKSALIKAATNIIPVSKMLFDFNVEEKEAESLTQKYKSVTIVHDSLKQICSASSKVLTIGNKQIKYRFLCLCSGGQPKLIPAAEKCPYIYGIRDTDSVVKLQDRVKSARRIVVVGNGGIASELIHEIKNVEVSWVIKDKHISATFVDPGAAEFFQHKLVTAEDQPEKSIVKRIRYSEENVSNPEGAALGPDWQKGLIISGSRTMPRTVTVHYSCEVISVDTVKDSDWPVIVKLTNGTQIECDMIVSATGVTPCSHYKSDQELKLSDDGGISVDWKMQTSLPNVYAAGDVCTAGWELAKHWFQMRLWSQARQMGIYAAKSMSSHMNNEEVIQDFCFELFAHSTKLFGYKVALLGLYNGQKLNNKYECLLRMTPALEYIKLVIVDGRVQGAVLIGDTGLEETIENLILNQLDVTSYGDDLLNPDIDIEDYFD